LRRHDAAQPVNVAQCHGATLEVDQSGLSECRQCPADGFELHAEIAADLLARHAQRERGARIAETAKAFCQLEQKTRDACLCAERAE
jgi:hypothetical protein